MKRSSDFVAASSLPRTSTTTISTNIAANESRDLLREYYRLYFPFDALARWLSCEQTLSHREIAYSFNTGAPDRYNGYVTAEQWAADVRRRVPTKIHIGAVYPCSVNPHRTRLGASFQPWRRELTFDIDANDYDNARWCCRGQRRVCASCWPLIAAAARIVDAQLRDEYGYERIAWFYSGRRGVHCWVSDTGARRLTVGARQRIIDAFSLEEDRYKRTADATAQHVTIDILPVPQPLDESAVVGDMVPLRRLNLDTHARLQPSLQRAYDIGYDVFTTLLVRQQVLSTPARWAELLAMLPCVETRRTLDTLWSQSQAPAHIVERWLQLCEVVRERLNTPAYAAGPHVIAEIVLSYVYPRIDKSVLRSINHMLKAPFAVHPSTGHIAVPLSLAHIEVFDPASALTVTELVSKLPSATQAYAALVRNFEASIRLQTQ